MGIKILSKLHSVQSYSAYKHRLPHATLFTDSLSSFFSSSLFSVPILLFLLTDKLSTAGTFIHFLSSLSLLPHLLPILFLFFFLLRNYWPQELVNVLFLSFLLLLFPNVVLLRNCWARETSYISFLPHLLLLSHPFPSPNSLPPHRQATRGGSLRESVSGNGPQPAARRGPHHSGRKDDEVPNSPW